MGCLPGLPKGAVWWPVLVCGVQLTMNRSANLQFTFSLSISIWRLSLGVLFFRAVEELPAG